ncbi:MAG: EscN/YscN/HrcN family type III secretion system ATPase, partial [Gemmata sp.]
KIRAIMAAYAEVHDLIRIGAYVRGTNAESDKAIELMPRVEKFLKQDVGEGSSFEQTRQALFQLAAEWRF